MIKYTSYKTSSVEWIGRLPSHWNEFRGKFQFTNKKEINREFQEENLLSLTLNGVLNKDMESNQGLRPMEYSSYQIFNENDLVFKLIDLENIKTSRVGLVHERGIMSPVYIRLEPKVNTHPKYYYYYYYDLYTQHIFNFLGSGVRSSLTPTDLLEIRVPVPPYSEQKTIVEYLDSKTSKIDRLLIHKEKKIEFLKEKKISLINELVTKGLETNTMYKDSGVEWIGKIPKHWEMTKIKYISKVYGRIGFRGYKTTDLVDEGEGVITLSPSNILDGELNLNKRTFLSYDKYYESPEIIIKEDDIIYVQRGSSIGKSTIIPNGHPEMTINPQLIIIKDFKCSPRYLHFVMNSEIMKIQTEHNINGGSTPLITQNSVENFVLPIPRSLDEQTEIVFQIENQTQEIDDLINMEKQKMELLNEYRKSIISEVIKGEIRVCKEDNSTLVETT